MKKMPGMICRGFSFSGPAFKIRRRLYLRRTGLHFGEFAGIRIRRKGIGRDRDDGNVRIESAWLSNPARAHALFGIPEVNAQRMMEWVACWLWSPLKLLTDSFSNTISKTRHHIRKFSHQDTEACARSVSTIVLPEKRSAVDLSQMPVFTAHVKEEFPV